MRRVTTPPVSRDRPPAEWDRHFAAIAKDGKPGHEPDSNKSEAKPKPATAPKAKVKAAKPPAKPATPPKPSPGAEQAEATSRRRKLDLLRRRKRSAADPEANPEAGAPAARAAEPEQPAAATPPWGDGWTTRPAGERPRPTVTSPADAEALAGFEPSASGPRPASPRSAPEPRTATSRPDRPWDRLRRIGWPAMTAPRSAVAAALLVAASGAAAAYVTTALENDDMAGQSASDHGEPATPAVTRELVSARTPEFVTVPPARPWVATPDRVVRPAISVPPPPSPSQLAEIPRAPVLNATAGAPPGRAAGAGRASPEPGEVDGWSPEIVSAPARPPSRATAAVSPSPALRPLTVPDAPARRPRPVSVPGASPRPDALAMPHRVYETPAAGPEPVEAAAVDMAPPATRPVERAEPAAVTPEQRPSPAAVTPKPRQDPAVAPSAAAPAEATGQRVARGDPLVGSVQRALKQAGLNPGPIDGIIGERTRAAIRDYQIAAGMETTGEIEPELVSRLTSADLPPAGGAQAAAQPVTIDEALTTVPEPARRNARPASAGPREVARNEGGRPAAARGSTRAPESEGPIEGMARALAELFGLPTEERTTTMASVGRPDGPAGADAPGADSGGTGGTGAGGADTGGSGGTSDSGASDSGASDSGASDSGASDSGGPADGGSASGGSAGDGSGSAGSGSAGSDAGSGSGSGGGGSASGGSGSGGSGSSGSDSGEGDADSGADTGDADTGDADTGDADTGDADTGDADTGDVGDVAGDVGEAVGGVAGSVGEAVGGVAGSVGEAVGGVAGAVGGAVGGGGGGPGGGEGGGRR